jgi:DNA/RNA-binding domain of Phe-tRNA-synthetase-like protein
MFVVSETWKQTWPGAAVGVLAMNGLANPKGHPELERRKAELEEKLRAQYTGLDRAALRSLPVMQAYTAYYKGFKKTYHLQLQLESVVFKNKPIPSMAALVEAMFMAELDTLLLTAGHDLDIVQPPVGIHVADGSEHFVRINGQEQQLKARDMYVADTKGVLSTIIYGPDQRTRITGETRRALFTTYAPPGIGEQAVVEHLQEIRDYALLVAPEAQVETLEAHSAG